jgi:hypothetical protein
MIETDGAIRKSSTGKWENVHQQAGQSGPQQDRGQVPPTGGGASTLCKEVKERFPCPAYSQAILPIHIVWVQRQLDRMPDESVHVARFGRHPRRARI